MTKVTVVSIEDAGFYESGNICGTTVKVTLKRGNDYAICNGVFIWEDYLADDETFDNWVECAMDGEEGYAAIIEEGDETAFYPN